MVFTYHERIVDEHKSSQDNQRYREHAKSVDESVETIESTKQPFGFAIAPGNCSVLFLWISSGSLAGRPSINSIIRNTCHTDVDA